MDCSDLARIINSDQVQSKLQDIKTSVVLHDKAKKNPLKNARLMQKLNPNAANARKAEEAAIKKR